VIEPSPRVTIADGIHGFSDGFIKLGASSGFEAAQFGFQL
jgi:hypothetical protein